MDGGLGAFVPGVTIGVTLAIGIVKARDEARWKIAIGVAAGLLLAGAMALALRSVGTDVDRLLIVVWVLASLALAAAVAMTAGHRRQRHAGEAPPEGLSGPA